MAIALLTVGCGEVARQADAGTDAPHIDPVAYHGALAQTTPVDFGGSPYCNYTVTLKQLSVDLTVLPQPTGPSLVSAGHIEALNHEETPMACPNGTIPDNIAKYNFAPSSPASGALTFTGDATNNPVVMLSVELEQTGTVYQVKLGFHRDSGVADILNWTVMATVSLSQR